MEGGKSKGTCMGGEGATAGSESCSQSSNVPGLKLGSRPA